MKAEIFNEVSPADAPAPSAPKVLPTTIRGYRPLRIHSYFVASIPQKADDEELMYIAVIKRHCAHFDENFARFERGYGYDCVMEEWFAPGGRFS
jgi:hypothetical protein